MVRRCINQSLFNATFPKAVQEYSRLDLLAACCLFAMLKLLSSHRHQISLFSKRGMDSM
ncbi:hypothetical protein K450DRAFT_228706 [Umbelopsis ramanniana AG]|uniref:Uncharacterized protein n=1 Tax=Umbelopsis ramanniana AG TaxID=1314678 RepID=A0AAD5EET3_UMBRA|nr:uncharacterized protein K450DRAFT_228706 [Umbelopsis ramanniana AG]KAI8582027.1 hypothetical protein K450DRAFT_228706 [Umbelopsis ramanniana AG]